MHTGFCENYSSHFCAHRVEKLTPRFTKQKRLSNDAALLSIANKIGHGKREGVGTGYGVVGREYIVREGTGWVRHTVIY